MVNFTVTGELAQDRGAFETLVRLAVLHTVMTVGSNRDRENPLPAVERFSEEILKPYREKHYLNQAMPVNQVSAKKEKPKRA